MNSRQNPTIKVKTIQLSKKVTVKQAEISVHRESSSTTSENNFDEVEGGNEVVDGRLNTYLTVTKPVLGQINETRSS